MLKKDIINRLNEITSDFNFIYIICNITLRDFCGTIDELSSKNPREHLNYNEVNFLIGLWIKNVDIKSNNEEINIQNITNEVYELMHKLHLTFLTGIKFENTASDFKLPSIFENGQILQESMFYSGTGAYDFQYTKWVTEKYKYDKEWLLENKKVKLELLPEFYNSVKKLQQEKLNKNAGRNNLKSKENSLNVFCLTEKEILQENSNYKGILENLINKIGITKNNTFNEVGDFNIFNEKPIIKLPNNNFFIPSPFCVSEAIYESPYYWMNLDEKYKSKALYNRGEAAEEITSKLVESVFGREKIFDNLIIKKNKKTRITDIDILAIHDNKAIVFQVKSKKLTSLSKNGNYESIKNDFEKAVKNAYIQGLISADCLYKKDDYYFESNKKTILLENKVTECYVVTIVLDNYPAITHQTHILLDKEYKEFPVAINIFDLEVLFRYLTTPSKFIEYISQRIKFSKYFKADNELCFLGFHLKKGLKKYNKSDVIVLDESWAQIFDKHYYSEISQINIPDVKHTKMRRNEPCYCGSNLKYKKCHGINN